MKMFLNITVSLLLIFNGAGALYGGSNLIIHPDGSSLQLSLELLKHRPFDDYFIPGLVLLVANGLFSVFILTAIIFRIKGYTWLIMIEGAILTGWIIIQMMLIREIYFLHFILGGVGLALIKSGYYLQRLNRN